MTTVTALGLIVAQISQEQTERSAGRPATIGVSAYDSQTGMPAPQADWDAAVADLLDRYRISTAATISYEQELFRLPGGTQGVQTMRVTPSYGELHRIQPIEGRWLREGDRASLSPALVVNEAFLEQMGLQDLSTHPTVVLGGPEPIRATVVGLIRGGFDQPMVYRVDRSAGAEETTASGPESGFYGPPTLELWVPSAQADEVIATVQHDLGLALDGVEVQAYRQDS